MKYLSEENVVKISIKEFVTIARRAFSPIAPSDDCEPSLTEASKLAYKILGIDRAKEKDIFYDFELKDCRARLFGKILVEDGTRVTLIYEISGNPKKPSREDVREARGEAYVLGFMLKSAAGLPKIDTRIVFINSSYGDFSEMQEEITESKLDSFFLKCKKTLEIYATPEIERVKERLPSLAKLKFPYPTVRNGQGDFIKSVYKTIARGGKLYASAPTGTGKTVSALYPALLSLGREKCDKVFYFTPKTTAQAAVHDCLKIFEKQGAKCRAVSLYSKEKICKSGLLCREDRELCKNSKCNNLSEALIALYNKNISVVTAEDIDAAAREFSVCPHELALSYSELADVVILDLNYLFDPKVYIRRYFTEGGNFAFLIDEAHNLPDRARDMFSAEINEDELRAPENEELLGAFSETKKLAPKLSSAFRSILFPYIKDELRTNAEGEDEGAVHLREIPAKLFGVFEKAVRTLEEEISLNLRANDEEKSARLKFLREYNSSLSRFLDVMNRFDSSYEMFIFLEGGKMRAKLYAVDPGTRIAERLELGRAAVFFSGTLSPIHYYKSTLGGDGTSSVLSVDSPFDTGQLDVTIMDGVSTRYAEREDTLTAVSRVIAATVSAKRGNYMIFSPSFAYTEALYKAFTAKYPKIHAILQKKDMTGKEKAAFLEEFSKNDSSYLIGFCVMGGIYSEGVDLAGDSLIGAVVVGVGLPALSYEREAIAAYYQEKYEEGREFAYIYPGMNRVLQAGGRVIRREDDRGIIVLIDDRFDDPIYKKLIPKLWQKVKFIKDPKALREELDKFWLEADKK
ncbi:MAG: ATP-dependent DNA helicase [Clostridia bacterium]|nr:ATP-dependent DNA helicase [Clostridia bacterium]